jgi:hypothetical protein
MPKLNIHTRSYTTVNVLLMLENERSHNKHYDKSMG